MTRVKRVALVTGAARGLGARIAIDLSRSGYRVAINYLSEKRLAGGIVRKIRRAGGEALAIRADVGRSDEVDAMVGSIISAWGRLDLLVNNAGLTHNSLLIGTREEIWDRVVTTNLKGAFNCSRAAAARMVRQRSGHIINICSILGVRGGKGESAYAASKAALIGFTKSLAKEMGPCGICVNAVIPGFMLTRMGRSASGTVREDVRVDSALKRFSDPGIVAQFIAHLSGMKIVTGQLFNLDGRIYRWS
ncbi:MAG: SDR family NAD(P)-dependent oxidoreductase [Candidatus Aureabacteria bacterium]|nr:SDR family NAD(P)-dependent oxidoreductase [Candidatus Auribacterota bacterium]